MTCANQRCAKYRPSLFIDHIDFYRSYILFGEDYIDMQRSCYKKDEVGEDAKSEDIFDLKFHKYMTKDL
jgi:hypothetical protein